MLILEGQAGPILALAFSPVGETLASAGKGNRVHLWSPPHELGQLQTPADTTLAIAFSPDGQYLAMGGDDRALHVWDLRDRKLIASSQVQQHPVTAAAFVGAGSVLFGIGERPNPVARPSTLFLQDIGANKPRRFPFDVVNGIRAIASLPDRKLAAWVTDNKLLRVQDISRPPSKAYTLRNDCRTLALSPDGRWLAATSDWETLLFNLNDWPKAPRTLGRHQGVVSCLAFGPDGRTLFSGGWDNTVRVWDLEQGNERASYRWPVGNRVNALAISPDGLRAAVAGDLGSVAMWDLD